jgi:uncharacterized membrane protein
MEKIKNIVKSKQGSVPVVMPIYFAIIIFIIGIVYGLVTYFA